MISVWSKIRFATAYCLAFSLLGACGKVGETVEIAGSSNAAPPNTSNQAPTIAGKPPRMVKAGVNYSFTPTASDPDSDQLVFSIRNKPEWANFDQSTGKLAGVALTSSVGTYNDVVISVSDGDKSAALPAFSISVEPIATGNMPPDISGKPKTSVIVGNTYTFIPTASDPDGDPLTFSAVRKPRWASFDPNSGGLTGNPQSRDIGDYGKIAITVSDGQTAASLPAFNIKVIAANTPPSISGAAKTSVTAGDRYSFQPTASDPDGDTLIFSIRNRPAWASFDGSSGQLSGTPSQTEVGMYRNVTITVSDGQLSTSLSAFDIEVTTIAPANRAPTISGSPDRIADIGKIYTFTPTADDPDGDRLSFSIRNRPDWASFDDSNGRLTGTPSQGDEGVYSSIGIAVTDGELTAALPQFSIDVSAATLGSVSLSWIPPTTNTDGSALTDLAGYKIYYGLAEGSYPNKISINNPGVTTYIVEDLAADDYHFFSTAINKSGIESNRSNVAIMTVK